MSYDPPCGQDREKELKVPIFVYWSYAGVTASRNDFTKLKSDPDYISKKFQLSTFTTISSLARMSADG